MKTHYRTFATFFFLISSQLGRAQEPAPFDSGSDGSYGPMVITERTHLEMPADGVFHCTTITVQSGATLTFEKNPLNTPVYLLAQGEVVIDGAIIVSGGNNSPEASGKGGPGGFDGGSRGVGPFAAGFGHGPGGGRNAGGKFLSVYGNALNVPLIGGSGSSGTSTVFGAGGGGAILIASSESIFINGSGQVAANGGSARSGVGNSVNGHSGSGGAVRLVAPIVGGTGRLSVSRGTAWNGSGESGRARIDSLDRFALRSLTLPSEPGSFTFGSQMFVFPPVQRSLLITKVGAQDIPGAAASMVEVRIPIDQPVEQTVEVRAENFTGTVPVTIQVVPENGASEAFTFEIDMGGNTTATGSATLNIPTDVVSRIYAWATAPLVDE